VRGPPHPRPRCQQHTHHSEYLESVGIVLSHWVRVGSQSLGVGGGRKLKGRVEGGVAWGRELTCSASAFCLDLGRFNQDLGWRPEPPMCLESVLGFSNSQSTGRSERRMRRAWTLPWLALAALLGAPSRAASGDASHEVSKPNLRKSAASLATIQKQLDEADRQIGDRTANRMVAWDAAAASSQAEHEKVGQGVLVLTVAVARAAGDLPLQRVYVFGPSGAEVELLPVGAISATVLKALRISGKAGANVWAEVYYLPAARRMARSSLIADFPGRKGFELGKLSDKLFKNLTDKNEAFTIDFSSIAAMALRNYEGLEIDTNSFPRTVPEDAAR